MTCECKHDEKAHLLGGACSYCGCEEYTPTRLNATEDDDEADVNDFNDHSRLGWNDHPLSDGPDDEDDWWDDEDEDEDEDES